MHCVFASHGHEKGSVNKSDCRFSCMRTACIAVCQPDSLPLLDACRARLGEDFAAADAAIRAKAAKVQVPASSQQWLAVAEQQHTAFGLEEGLPAERPESASSTVDSVASGKASSWRMQQTISTAQLGLALSDGDVTRSLSAAGGRPGSGFRQQSRPSSVGSIAGSRRSTGSIRSANRVQTVQLVLDVA